MTATESGRLQVIATPIGNLDDLSPRAQGALREADCVACEDTRRTGRLLRRLGSTVPVVSNHEHNEAGRVEELVARMRRGDTVALVSDAGMPVISDPGWPLVSAAIDAGVPVEVIPGPSAVETALVASGLPAHEFAFVGFFPRTAAKRRELLHRWERFSGSVVGFEGPSRIAGLLAEVAADAPDRMVAVCRELTKLHEQVVRGRAADVAEWATQGVRGEVTVVLGPVDAVPAEQTADRVAAVLIEAGLTPRAAADVAGELGVGSRNAVYRAALAASKRRTT